jgi:hypothetical protein
LQSAVLGDTLGDFFSQTHPVALFSVPGKVRVYVLGQNVASSTKFRLIWRGPPQINTVQKNRGDRRTSFFCRAIKFLKLVMPIGARAEKRSMETRVAAAL